MFSKLMKYEWNYYQKVLPIMLISIFSFILLLLPIYFCILLQNYNKFLPDESYAYDIAIFSVFFLFIVYYFAVIVIMLISKFVIASRYYKGMYTDQGYLTHTLPVTKTQLYFSKLLSGFLFDVCIMLSIAFSFFIFILVYGKNFPIIDSLLNDLEYLTSLITFSSDPESNTVWLLFVLLFILSSVAAIILIYACITIGQTFTKHRIIGAIAVYFIINIGLQTAYSVILVFLQLIQSILHFSPSLTTDITLIVVIILAVLMTLILFFVTKRNLTQKLNLK